MRIVLSYVLLIALALSGLTGSVQSVQAFTLADAIAQHQQKDSEHNSLPDAAHSIAADAEMPCHSNTSTLNTNTIATDADHSCCEQVQHQCKGDCCTKHCATASALLATELFRYVRPVNTITKQTTSLPQWVFVEDPPPPINA